jgi:pimeloyl-ACP methyl ester carboxylesterase
MLDESLVATLGRFEEDGLVEEYLSDPVGRDGLAVLARPEAAGGGTGFVFCRSPGPEQGALQRLEALTARELGARGIPSVRIRRGFADDGEPTTMDIDEALAEARDAAAVLAATGIEQVGVIGELLGAAVALETANRLELPLVVLIAPTLDGRAYLRDLYRRHLITGFMSYDEQRSRREPLDDQLARGPVSIRGVRLTRKGADAVAAVDLAALGAGFAGSALIAGVTRSGKPDAALDTLVRSLPGDVTMRSLRDELYVPFGELPSPRSRARAGCWDIWLELDRALARLTADWAAAR